MNSSLVARVGSILVLPSAGVVFVFLVIQKEGRERLLAWNRHETVPTPTVAVSTPGGR